MENGSERKEEKYKKTTETEMRRKHSMVHWDNI